ncbi:Ras guanine nucleotide exchange factor bud5 [Coemansia erecta]|nr:Ras guanine nucleotide exchange factor bud5 [Coemansia erecta]
MAFYFKQGNDAERIEVTSRLTQGARDQRSLATDDDVRRSYTSGRRRELLDTILPSRPGAARREPRRGKIFGEAQAKVSSEAQATSDRTRAEHWRGMHTRLNPLSDTNEVLINSEGRVSYGTWHGLIAYLTQVHRPSDTYTRAFFLAFRSFATPVDLADALVARARELAVVRAPAESRIRTDRAKRSILHNVFLAIKHWYERYWWALADDATLPFLCGFLINEYMPGCHGAEAKECQRLLLYIASKNESINLRSLASSSATRSANSVRKLANNAEARGSESIRGSRPKGDTAAALSRDTRAADQNNGAAAVSVLEQTETRGSHHTRHSAAGHRGFWHRLFGKRRRSSDSDSGSSLFMGSPCSDGESRDDSASLQSDYAHEHNERARDSGVRMTSEHSDGPDISDMLLATVGMDLSIEAYRRITHIYQVSPVDVACQLTIIESSCYCQIEPHELVNKEFSRGPKSHAHNVRQMSRWCTQITWWASATILSERTAERRCRMLKYFIDLGIQLLALKNFDAVMAVKAAVYSAAVMRLKKTWSLLPKKYTIMCRRLHEATDADRNYANYRGLLRRSQPPLLPFLGLYLTDLTFLDDGNPTYRRFEQPDDLVQSASRHVRTDDSCDSTPPVQLTGQTCALFARREDVDLDSRAILINFEKVYRVAAIIEEMQKFQVEYSGNFTMAIPGLQQYLIELWAECENAGYDDDKIYALSLSREPRAQCPANNSDIHMRALPAGMRFSRLLPGAYQRQRNKEPSIGSISDD